MRGRGVDMGLGGKGVGRRGFGMKVRIKKTDGEGRRFQRGGGGCIVGGWVTLGSRRVSTDYEDDRVRSCFSFAESCQFKK